MDASWKAEVTGAGGEVPCMGAETSPMHVTGASQAIRRQPTVPKVATIRTSASQSSCTRMVAGRRLRRAMAGPPSWSPSSTASTGAHGPLEARCLSINNRPLPSPCSKAKRLQIRALPFATATARQCTHEELDQALEVYNPRCFAAGLDGFRSDRLTGEPRPRMYVADIIEAWVLDQDPSVHQRAI